MREGSKIATLAVIGMIIGMFFIGVLLACIDKSEASESAALTIGATPQTKWIDGAWQTDVRLVDDGNFGTYVFFHNDRSSTVVPSVQIFDLSGNQVTCPIPKITVQGNGSVQFLSFTGDFCGVTGTHVVRFRSSTEHSVEANYFS